MSYTVIYDGQCNLCSNLVNILQHLDRGHHFQYIPMQDEGILSPWGVTMCQCDELGMMVIDNQDPSQRWQGSEAAEQIARVLPAGEFFMALYCGIPGLKWMGDRSYKQVRDHRYAWFGRRDQLFRTDYPQTQMPHTQDREKNQSEAGISG